MTVDILTGKCYPVFMANLIPRRKPCRRNATVLPTGYHGTALQDILAASGAPRGSLYFHFRAGRKRSRRAPSRLETRPSTGFIAHVAGTSRTAETFVINLARGMAANLEASDFREGCPLATTALEIATDSEAIGKATREAFAAGSARSRKHWLFGADREQAAAAATAILSQVEGALLLARSPQPSEPMRRAEEASRLLVKSHRGRRSGQPGRD